MKGRIGLSYDQSWTISEFLKGLVRVILNSLSFRRKNIYILIIVLKSIDEVGFYVCISPTLTCNCSYIFKNKKIEWESHEYDTNSKVIPPVLWDSCCCCYYWVFYCLDGRIGETVGEWFFIAVFSFSFF